MATMTRVHFNLIADGLKESKPYPADYFSEEDHKIALLVWKQVAFTLSNKFTRTNPSFDENRFLKACGFEL